MFKSGLAHAVDEFIVESDEFCSKDVIEALPAFKPQAVHQHLNWLVSTGRLVAYRSEAIHGFMYRREDAEVQNGERFHCSDALILAMKRLSGCGRKPAVEAPESDPVSECREWVARLVERAHATSP